MYSSIPRLLSQSCFWLGLSASYIGLANSILYTCMHWSKMVYGAAHLISFTYFFYTMKNICLRTYTPRPPEAMKIWIFLLYNWYMTLCCMLNYESELYYITYVQILVVFSRWNPNKQSRCMTLLIRLVMLLTYQSELYYICWYKFYFFTSLIIC